MPLRANTCSDILYLPTMPHLCPRSQLPLPTWQLSNVILWQFPPHSPSSKSTCPKPSSWSPTVSFSPAAFPTQWRAIPSFQSLRSPWCRPWLLSSHPTSDLLASPSNYIQNLTNSHHFLYSQGRSPHHLCYKTCLLTHASSLISLPQPSLLEGCLQQLEGPF